MTARATKTNQPTSTDFLWRALQLPSRAASPLDVSIELILRTPWKQRAGRRPTGRVQDSRQAGGAAVVQPRVRRWKNAPLVVRAPVHPPAGRPRAPIVRVCPIRAAPAQTSE